MHSNQSRGPLGSISHFIGTYIFSRDHKIIGIQFLISTLLWFLVGGILALGVRWQIAWPQKPLPFGIGQALFPSTNGQMPPAFYTMLFTMHASVMIFFVIIPILAGAFGNFVIPLQIGARDMAFPTLNMLSYWFMWPAFIIMGYSFTVEGGAAAAGWTGYPTLASIKQAAPGSLNGQTLWLISLIFVGVSSLMGSVNYITTIVKLRAPGMHLFRMPLTTWSLFITAILQAFALPVLTAALLMQVIERVFDASFFKPVGLFVNSTAIPAGGGQVLLWQHLFWFYSHPAVYIMILPAMGMVSDIIATFSRKPIFGYRPMIYSISGIAGLGFIVWGHHMFQSGMNPALGMTFMVSTMFIALPSAIKVFNWLGTLWGAKIRFSAAMLNALAFVGMFVIGGLSGIFMAATPVDIYIHDTYYIVAHIHYVLFGGSMFAIFGGIYYWFPKMFGKKMDERIGRIHFLLSFIAFNCTFFPMHIIGMAGHPRRIGDPYNYQTLSHLQGLNSFMTMSAFMLGFFQLLFVWNFFKSMFVGEKCGRNPWECATLEWDAPSPPGHGNFETLPHVHRGPYEYSMGVGKTDYLAQTAKLEGAEAEAEKAAYARLGH